MSSTAAASAAADSTGSRVGLLVGSSRARGNWQGLSAWVELSILRLSSARPRTVRTPSTVSVFGPESSPLPLGPVTDGERIPAQRGEFDYPSPAVREWSAIVRSLSGVVILTPQYNWGLPGELKNSLDHLYLEWRGKPLLSITYGGHGGAKADDQLRQVCGGGLKMRVAASRVNLTLPEEFIRHGARIATGADSAEPLAPFLVEAQATLDTAINEWLDLIDQEASEGAAQAKA